MDAGTDVQLLVEEPVPDDDGDPRAFPASIGALRVLDVIGLTVLGVVAVVLRFWTTSPMWLDEALTVHIASQSLGQIPQALRHDGHPPLYYFMLHGWMSVFGQSNQAIRALPGIFGVLTIPALWATARRVGGTRVAWCAVVFVAVLPFALRYSTENRMYSLVMLLVLLGWLCADSVLRRPRPMSVIGLVLCTSALLWSHYWALWLGITAAVVVVAMLIRDHRRSRPARVRAELWILGSLAVGAVTFLPWVPTMLYQQAHTGTPWANRSMPPTVLVTSLEALGGPHNATDQVAGWFFALLILVGLFGAGVASGRILIDLRTRPRARAMAILAGGTIGIGVAVMLATNSAFQARYNAAWLPFAFVLGGMGLSVIRGPVLQRGAIALVLIAAVPGAYKNVETARTQSAVIASAIEANGHPGDVVALCPDQLGPSLTRVLKPGFDVGSYPTFSDPHTVDWVDYDARTHAATPQQFADLLLRRAGPDHRIFLVWSDRYITHKNLCTEVNQLLAANRPQFRELVSAQYQYFEAANLTGFWPGRR